MSKPEKIFVVVDPNDTTHIALERVIITSTLRDVKPKVHAFVAVDPNAVDTRTVNENVFRDLSWFESAIKNPLINAGIDFNLEVSWSSEWQKSIMESAKRFDADLIYLPVHATTASSRFLFTESKWELLKGAYCPVVLIRPGAKAQRKVILAAVNFQAERDVQKELNKKIVAQAKYYAEVYGADLHVINGYMDSMSYPDRAKILAETGLPNDKIHVDNGYTSDVVSALAEKINADLIVMGTLGQNGMTKTRRGNTAERLIAAVDTDVMVISHE
ncbi:universal stress protein [Cellvibrio japonicus]|uniref:Universal stress protein family n=1 Tax=Cellvibrio japonicus (strain Ueda107) TaxID=498211 RepID=B3PLH3_CELJU|nr:universal stress protein [Cellvibrio japonicus]ACE85238.1 universal stress protein family [Cellvibrio japonicus Ueda107]QEI12963.1 universal stress protein [Cellvibrio japonicus]QEI16537.1 universal stress protein [Cellvibrio japonicus]QEI20115.1 universal stress protein [Cellvibrio japonicus]